MEKYKLCPACGAKNAPNRIECDVCEADITAVPVTTFQQDKKPSATPRFVRVCDCGARNPPQARRCTACGEDIADIIATEDGESASEPRDMGTLASLDGGFAFALYDGEMTLGRNRDMREYLKRFTYVSRSQAKLFWRDGALMLASLSHTNPTYVNDAPLDIDQEVQLRDGDEIGLGGCVIDGKRQDQAAYLIVHLPGSEA